MRIVHHQYADLNMAVHAINMTLAGAVLGKADIAGPKHLNVATSPTNFEFEPARHDHDEVVGRVQQNHMGTSAAGFHNRIYP